MVLWVVGRAQLDGQTVHHSGVVVSPGVVVGVDSNGED